MTKFFRKTRTLLTAAAILSAIGAHAMTVTGTVTNGTVSKPASGDTVAAIALMQGMQEVTKSTTDSHGHYKLTVPDGGQYLVHVTHQGADYFARVTPGAASIDVDVYDVAPHVDGISGEAIVVRAETDAVGKTLNIGMNMFVNNASAPAKTEFGGNTFDFYLPKGAIVVETVASGPNGMPVQTPAKQLDNNGHYAFTFPLRPGESRFEVSYTLPYDGKQLLSIKQTLPTNDVAIMLPKAMTFDGKAPTQFQPINDGKSDPTVQTIDAHQPAFTQPVEFTVSGQGQLPQTSDVSQSGGDASSEQASGSGNSDLNGGRPGGGLGNPIESPDPLSKYKWWIVGGISILLVAAAGFLLSPKSQNTMFATSAEPNQGGNMSDKVTTTYTQNASLQALKDELFHLETDRHSGKITEEQYAIHKGAIDTLMRRVLARDGNLGEQRSSPFIHGSQSDPYEPEK